MPPVAAPRRITNRLDTLNKSGLIRRAPVLAPPVKKATCCDDPKIEDDDGAKVCRNCYTQVAESNIVADVTFQEDSRGAATVQGGFISENARHARTLGSAAYRRVGGGEKNSIQEIEANGRRELASLCPRLQIPETVSMQAASIWSLAAKQSFTAGRRTDEVIAACLYAACRRQKENTVLLMDISEQQKINVFRLGEVYKDLCRELFLENDNQLGFQHLVEIEPLIFKYCRNLEFGDMTRQVAEDAVKIIRRMKRDWMVTGRHPAGLCGGAIILAARMNNFRRTVREIVYVSKVADVTVAKRVEEFRRTRSAALTVAQFRKHGVQLKHQADPPSLHEADRRREKFESKKRKRQAHNLEREESESVAPDLDGQSAVTTPSESSETTQNGRPRKRARSSNSPASPPEQQQPRFDSDGFAIPALPIDPAITGEDQPRRRGRPRKPDPVIEISEEELADEQELENEIEEVLDDPKIIDTRNDIEKAKAEERSRLLADEQRRLDAEKTQARRSAAGVDWFPERDVDSNGNDNEAQPTEEDLEAEFANDPEVINCRLTDEEARAKEKIWVAFNEDWLRTQHEKELKAKIAEATGNKDGVGRKSRATGKQGRKKAGKMGDGSLLLEANTPIETPADANAAMLAKRAPLAFSRYVNYEALSRVYGAGSRTGSEAPTATASQAGSPSREPTPSQAAEEGSASPRPAALPTPQATQADTAAPVTEPSEETQANEGAADGAEEEEEVVADEVDEGDGYNDDYGSTAGDDYYGGHDDYGDDDRDYDRALNMVGGADMEGTFDDY